VSNIERDKNLTSCFMRVNNILKN